MAPSSGQQALCCSWSSLSPSPVSTSVLLQSLGEVERDALELLVGTMVSSLQAIACLHLACAMPSTLGSTVGIIKSYESMLTGPRSALLLAASLSQIVFAIFAIIGAKRGLGKHIWDFPLVSATATSLGQLSLIKLREVIVILFCIYVAYALAITFTKLSLIASYLRVFPDKRFRQLMYVISASVILLCIASTIVIIFQCNPASSAWDWSIRRDQCLNIHTFLYASSAINTCTDFVLWAAPLPLVWKLHMSKKAKVGLAFLFGCGLV